MLTAISGINWGDEGKGRMVDLLSEKYDVVVRYQGGNNAGHTVVNEQGKFVLNLLPSGILRPEVVNVMGTGMVIDIKHLSTEVAQLRSRGVELNPENLKISERAAVCLPYHPLLDNLEEDRLGDEAYGSTRRGIAPCYSDKYLKKTLRMGDLLHLDDVKERLRDIMQQKNAIIEKVYGGQGIDFADTFGWMHCYAAEFAPFICDTGLYLEEQAEQDKNILFEAQLGALRDVDYGIVPFTSSSNTLAAYAPIGAGVPGRQLDKSIGVTKAYSTCVGGGPFVVEMQGSDAESLRRRGQEFGATTGRPRRVGGFDVVASRYGCRMQGADEIVLTMLDVLSYMRDIPVCTAYTIDGNPTTEFPFGDALNRAEPVFRSLAGWQSDITEVRKKEDLPKAAREYIAFVEKSLDCPVTLVSVGPDRDAYIEM